MNRATVRSRVRKNLNDAGVTFYTDDDLNDSIQDAYNTFCALTGIIVKSTAFPILPSAYWNLASAISDYLFPVGFYNLSTNLWLEGKTRRYFSGLRWDWEKWIGQPAYFAPVDYRRICVVPHLTVGSGLGILLYKAKAPNLSDEMPLQCPVQANTVFENYVTADLLEQDRELAKAASYWDGYYTDLDNAIEEIHNPSRADLMYVLRPYLELPRFGRGTVGGDMNIDNETPSGIINGTNAIFTLATVPNPSASLSLFKNGQLMFEGEAYTLVGSTITFSSSFIPKTGDVLRAWYRVN